VAGRPLRPATDHRHGRPSPHRPANRPQAPPRAGLLPFFWSPLETRTYAELPAVSHGYPPPQGRLPTCYAPVRRAAPPKGPAPDLHALGTPPALILSQDQTLHQWLRRAALRRARTPEGILLLRDVGHAVHFWLTSFAVGRAESVLTPRPSLKAARHQHHPLAPSSAHDAMPRLSFEIRRLSVRCASLSRYHAPRRARRAYPRDSSPVKERLAASGSRPYPLPSLPGHARPCSAPALKEPLHSTTNAALCQVND
jgi:hypothetical protein